MFDRIKFSISASVLTLPAGPVRPTVKYLRDGELKKNSLVLLKPEARVLISQLALRNSDTNKIK